MLRQDGGWPCFSSSSSMDSSLISAPRRDSLLLEITSFQRQPRISFRKFIDRRNISSEEETMYIHAFIVYGDAEWSHVYRFQLRLSRKFRIRNAFKRDANDEMRFKSSNGACASFCLSWTRYPLTLGIGRSTIDAFHATATLYPILGVSSRAKRNAF